MNSVKRHDASYDNFVSILKAELIPATGCTEPIAIAYAASKAAAVLGAMPESCEVYASGNIIKNVKSVVVPNTDGLRGIEAAAAAGIIAGDPDAQLQVISHVSAEQRGAIKAYCEDHDIKVVPVVNGKVFFLSVLVRAGGESAQITIENYHTNITRIEKNGECIFEQSGDADGEVTHDQSLDYALLSVEKILDFADICDLKDVEDILERQIEYNSAISAEGLANPWGAQIGRTLVSSRGMNIKNIARAAAAAGSDARMSGCEMPVVIVSGSGNQGMTASVPVIRFAEMLGSSREKLLRALIVSDLLTIHQKTSIGRLSAFCGATSAGCGAAAGIAYLYGFDCDVVSHTISNTLGILSGMVCDGAKPSCAAKIAMAVDAGILGMEMYISGQNKFLGGDGIIKEQVDDTIASVGRMASRGMRETDREILDIMTE